MNRQNFLGHLALAATIILVAAFAGQIRRWQREPRHNRRVSQTTTRTELGKANRNLQAEVLVRFRPGTSLDKIKEVTRSLNDRIEDRVETVDGLFAIDDQDGVTAEIVAAEYRAFTDVVEYAEPNFRINLEPNVPDFTVKGEDSSTESTESTFTYRDGKAPNDPRFNDQWSLSNNGQRGGKDKADIDTMSAWVKTTGSSKVVVAVLDSGVDYTHPDLASNMWVRPAGMDEYRDDQLGTIDDIHGFNAIENMRDPMDENGHGTHCAGIIGAEGDNGVGIAGINWQVEIMPLKFMNANGSGTTKDAIEAINYVIDRKRAGVNVRVISASWGSTMKSKALEDAIRRAGEEGILFIAAAGNSSADSDKSPHYPAGYELPNIISVAALNRQDELASFSNYGAKSVHVAAPGAEILSTWLRGEFEEHSGTSMATPEVAGVAALVLSVEPKLDMEKLRTRILESVDPLPALKGKVSTGGRLNAARAVGAK
jgi:subtilisin family serine protease